MGKKKDQRKSNALETEIGGEQAATAPIMSIMNDGGHEEKKGKGGGKGKKRSNKLDMLKQAIEDDESDDKVSTDREEPLPLRGKEKSKKRGKERKEKVDNFEKNVDDEEDVEEDTLLSEEVGAMRFDHSSESEPEKDQFEDKEKVKSKKMTRKEKKEAQKKAKFEAEMEQMSVPGSQFAISQQEQSAKGAVLENATDIKVESFSISARGKDLFIDAALTIAHGRRYGLVGPNGMGKTTLLAHIANRALAIPPNIDSLLCEQDVQADETPAVEVVLMADKKRSALLEEVVIQRRF
eukprot:Seg449.1_Seg449.3 transcript_id=Seg449.1_Seg449.3/GoldUCD/mRNA.D3Y31 product="ATP-binding cassette sub-family F member 1" protein_id=Seg449.1_Seg449.3/GoldUCD/D3Y31